jgi:hypothetical protein
MVGANHETHLALVRSDFKERLRRALGDSSPDFPLGVPGVSGLEMLQSVLSQQIDAMKTVPEQIPESASPFTQPEGTYGLSDKGNRCLLPDGKSPTPHRVDSGVTSFVSAMHLSFGLFSFCRPFLVKKGYARRFAVGSPLISFEDCTFRSGGSLLVQRSPHSTPDSRGSSSETGKQIGSAHPPCHRAPQFGIRRRIVTLKSSLTDDPVARLDRSWSR